MTLISTSAPHYAPEDLLGMDGLFELVGGQLVGKQMGYLAGLCAANITEHVRAYVRQVRAGDVVVEVTFQCFPHKPDLVRRPDIAFVAADRAKTVPREGHVRIAPDLAIEVISPGDRINDFEEKLVDYRMAGIKLVWEVNPALRQIRIHRLDRTNTLLEESDTLTGEAVLPGFSVKVSELMPTK